MADAAQVQRRYPVPIEHARRAIVLVDARGCVLSWDSAAEHIFGYGREEILGRPFTLLALEKVDLKDMFDESARVRLSAGAVFECTGRHRDGCEFPLECTCAPEAGRKPARYICCVEDATSRTQAGHKLATACRAAASTEQAKNEFLANISHEIRTPLNAVIGMSELLMETNPTDEQREFVELLMCSSRALVSLVNAMLDFSRLKTGRLVLNEAVFDVRAQIKNIMEAYVSGAREAGLELIWHVDDNVPGEVHGDPGRVRQIITCLVDNAVKFTERGSVRLICEATSGEVLPGGSATAPGMLRIAVRDTGIGIPNHKQEEIFESFTQADGSMTRRFGGTGMGLSIARELTGLMRGQLRVESTEGLGSTFIISLPLRFRTPTAAQPGGAAAEPALIKNVLVVDASRVRSERLIRLCSGMKVVLTRAETCCQARRMSEAAGRAGRPYDLAVIEYSLPDGDGFALVDDLRSAGLLHRTRCIVLVSAGLQGDLQRCRELGIAAYLQRPVRREIFVEAFNRVLSGAGEDVITRHVLECA